MSAEENKKSQTKATYCCSGVGLTMIMGVRDQKPILGVNEKCKNKLLRIVLKSMQFEQ
jgi:hypothetical protein